MTFIPPQYKCNKCGIINDAEWYGSPSWDVPHDWHEPWDDSDKHYCPNCFVKLQCTGCETVRGHTEDFVPDKEYPCHRCKKHTKWNLYDGPIMV